MVSMSVTRLAVLGAGSVRCTVPVVASLATYFGERPLEVRLFDADEERLDLFDRLARTCFAVNRATHSLLASSDAAEAVEEADRIVVQVGANCARKYLKARRRQGFAELDAASLVEQALESILAPVSGEDDVLSLVGEDIALPLERYHRLDWPEAPALAERAAVPHQVLRWIHGEEPLYTLLRTYERSPFKSWLDDPESAPLVLQARAF